MGRNDLGKEACGQGGVRRAAWLAHIELLAGLPYPATVLMPTLVAAIRTGFDADFGNFGWVEGERLKPRAFWTERMTEESFRWFMVNFEQTLAEAPLRAQFDSDGEVIRALVQMPGYEETLSNTHMMAPLGVRWAMCVPVVNRDGECHGFLYLHRRAEAGPFTDEEQALLREVRDRLVDLGSAPSLLPPCSRRATSTAKLHVGADGQFLARSPHAAELLYQCNDGRMGLLNWAAPDVSALPAPARQMVERHLSRPAATTDHFVVETAGGAFDFRVEPLQRLADGVRQIIVSMRHLEPIDITVARQLLAWPLSPKEKQLVVASVRQPTQQDLASHLGIAVSTLKGYVNELHAKLGVPSRQALIDRLLGDARHERGLATA